MTATVERFVRFPLGGPCAVCGFPASQLVIYETGRQVWHQPGNGAPCLLPNPPKGGAR